MSKPFYRNTSNAPRANEPSRKPEQVEAIRINQVFDANKQYEVISAPVVAPEIWDALKEAETQDLPKIILTDGD